MAQNPLAAVALLGQSLSSCVVNITNLMQNDDVIKGILWR